MQVAAWRDAYAGVLPDDVLDALSTDEFASAWHASITRPTEARSRVLVAIDDSAGPSAGATPVVGFAAVTMSDDPDAEPGQDGLISELAVDPGYRDRGHGSRLMNAAIETLAADGMGRASVWLTSTADASRAFFTAAGWQPDGAHRELDLYGDGSVRVKQVRLHCATAADDQAGATGRPT